MSNNEQYVELITKTMLEGSLDGLKKFLSENAIDVNSFRISFDDMDNNSILMVAASFGKLDMVEYLVNTCSADIDYKNSVNMTALSFAVGSIGRNPDVVKFLLDKGADASIKDIDNYSLIDAINSAKEEGLNEEMSNKITKIEDLIKNALSSPVKYKIPKIMAGMLSFGACAGIVASAALLPEISLLGYIAFASVPLLLAGGIMFIKSGVDESNKNNYIPPHADNIKHIYKDGNASEALLTKNVHARNLLSRENSSMGRSISHR